MIFRLDVVRPARLEMKLRPFVMAGILETQRLGVNLNGTAIGTLVLRDAEPAIYAVLIPGGVLRQDNLLVLELPDARSLTSLDVSRDQRRIALSVNWLRLVYLE